MACYSVSQLMVLLLFYCCCCCCNLLNLTQALLKGLLYRLLSCIPYLKIITENHDDDDTIVIVVVYAVVVDDDDGDDDDDDDVDVDEDAIC